MSKLHGILTIAAFLALGLCASVAQSQENSNDAAPMASTPATPMENKSNEHVTRALFTTAIQNREPTDTVTSLTNDKNKIYFFSELKGMGGHIVTHRWEYQGKTMGEVKFNVGGPRWRVWSSKSLLPQWTGEWRVSILDESGKLLGEATFNYTENAKNQN